LDKQLFSFNGIYCFLFKNSYSKCSNDVQTFFINIFYGKKEETSINDILKKYLDIGYKRDTKNQKIEQVRQLNNVLTRNEKSDFRIIFNAIKTNLANYKDEDEYKAKDKYFNACLERLKKEFFPPKETENKKRQMKFKIAQIINKFLNFNTKELSEKINSDDEVKKIYRHLIMFLKKIISSKKIPSKNFEEESLLLILWCSLYSGYVEKEHIQITIKYLEKKYENQNIYVLPDFLSKLIDEYFFDKENIIDCFAVNANLFERCIDAEILKEFEMFDKITESLLDLKELQKCFQALKIFSLMPELSLKRDEIEALDIRDCIPYLVKVGIIKRDNDSFRLEYEYKFFIDYINAVNFRGYEDFRIFSHNYNKTTRNVIIRLFETKEISYYDKIFIFRNINFGKSTIVAMEFENYIKESVYL